MNNFCIHGVSDSTRIRLLQACSTPTHFIHVIVWQRACQSCKKIVNRQILKIRFHEDVWKNT